MINQARCSERCSRQLSKSDQDAEAHRIGRKSFSEDSLENQLQCPQAGNPLPSVDNLDDAGLDCTKPDWEVVKPTQLPEEPGPSQFHNDKYWDERSLDEDLQKKEIHQEIIDEEVKNSIDRQQEDFSRPFRNDASTPTTKAEVILRNHLLPGHIWTLSFSLVEIPIRLK